MDGGSFHPVLHGGVSLRLDLVVDEELDLCNVSVSQFYAMPRLSSAPLVLGHEFRAASVYLFRRAVWQDFFTCLKVVEILNGPEIGAASTAFSVPDFGTSLPTAAAVSVHLSPTVWAIDL